MIPDNISKEHILKAIRWIDNHGVPKERKYTKFIFVFEGKKYPPKYVILIANIFANGKELLFSGEDETNSFLIKQGFSIVRQ